jgi:regulatory protein
MPVSPLYSLLEAKHKIEAFCAYQERCDQEVRLKLRSWNMDAEHVDILISDLITHNFLNEERFAEAYVSGKFRIKKWGRVKIRQHLKQKNISAYSINKALATIDDKEYLSTIRELLETKSRLVKSKDKWDRLNKLKRYLASKGYETELIHEMVV